MAAIADFNIDQGTDKTVYFALKDENGPLNLRGYLAAMQVRLYAFSEDAIDTLTVDNGGLQIDEEGGRVIANFKHEFTEKYPCKGTPLVYDLELESPDGKITRVVEGKITVSPEVTRVQSNRSKRA